MRKFVAIALLACGPQVVWNLSGAETLNTLLPERIGVRGGFSLDSATDDFHQVELAAGYDLPWHWHFGEQWVLQTGLDAGAGWLGAGNREAAVFSLGPQIALRYERWGLSLVGGSSPTYITRSEFNNRNLGGEFHFTSHIGLAWDFARHFQVSYRLQHLSNAGLEHPNPGLNMHMFAFSWLF